MSKINEEMEQIQGGSITADMFKAMAEKFDFRNVNTKRSSKFFAHASALTIPKGEHKLFSYGRGQGQSVGTLDVTDANVGAMSEYDTSEEEKDGQVEENSVFIATGMKIQVIGWDTSNNRGKALDYEGELMPLVGARANVILKTGIGQKLTRLDTTMKELIDIGGYEAVFSGIAENAPVVKPAIGDGFYDFAPEFPYFKNKSRREVVFNVLKDITFPAGARGIQIFCYMKGIEVLDIASMFE